MNSKILMNELSTRDQLSTQNTALKLTHQNNIKSIALQSEHRKLLNFLKNMNEIKLKLNTKHLFIKQLT